jgi:sugar lactone lactonase YvrE
MFTLRNYRSLWMWILGLVTALQLIVPAAYAGPAARTARTGSDTMVVNTVAGDPASRNTLEGIPALQAYIDPRSIEIGPDGTIYIIDFALHRVRKVTPDGTIRTIAGGTPYGYSGDGGPAVSAHLNSPRGLALGPDGSVYIADSFNSRIRKIDPSGIITTVAGNGTLGAAGDNGPAAQAQLGRAEDVAVAADGSLYIADTRNRRIRKVNPDGIIVTIAGMGSDLNEGGPAYSAAVDEVHNLALGPDGSLYFGSYRRVRRITFPDGTITTVAGNNTSATSGDGGPASAASFSAVGDVAVDQSNGDVYVIDSQRVRRVRDGIINTVIGTGQVCVQIPQGCEEGLPATATKLAHPRGLAVGPDGSVYFSEGSARRVRRATTVLGQP